MILDSVTKTLQDNFMMLPGNPNGIGAERRIKKARES